MRLSRFAVQALLLLAGLLVAAVLRVLVGDSNVAVEQDAPVRISRR